ncbi:glycosyltransferase, partial [Candidatus Micrarchaeota archaeon]|nr:glycosyltransferase [Candidatus Micrarchaeota archaeon]
FAESLACEVPVVAFDQPFWKGLYDDSALFVEKSPKALAEGIEKVLDDKNLRKRLVANGRKCVERYDVSHTVDAYLELYRELASRKR